MAEEVDVFKIASDAKFDPETMEKSLKEIQGVVSEGGKITGDNINVDLSKITEINADYQKNVLEPLSQKGYEFTAEQKTKFETQKDQYTKKMYDALTGNTNTDFKYSENEGYKTIETNVNERFKQLNDARITIDPPSADIIELSDMNATIEVKIKGLDGELKRMKIDVNRQDMESSRKFADNLSKSDRVQDREVGKKLTEILDSIDKSNFDKFSEKTKKLAESIKENGGTILKIALALLFSYEIVSLFSQSLTGCMGNVTDSKTNKQSKCILKKFTANPSNPIPSSDYCNDTHMGCTDPAIPNDTGDNCIPDYKGSNQIAPPGSSDKICSIFCDNKYLVQSNGNLTYSYGCEKCDFMCALGVMSNSLFNNLVDSGNNVVDWIKKYGIIIVYIVAGLIALGLIGWIVKVANTVYHEFVPEGDGTSKGHE